ncbi:MAG: DUF2177 family protein [Deltaproteobacteria bacterium]
MTVLILYAVTATVFLVLDGIMLTFVMKPLFTAYIGDLMASQLRLAPAAVFYLAYVAGLIYLVSYPALKSGAPLIIPAAILGALAYGTYEFTSYSIMKGWSPVMVATDVIWGTVLTSVSAWVGVAAARAWA